VTRLRRVGRAAWLAASAFQAGAVLGAAEPQGCPAVLDPAALEARGAVVGQVLIRAGDVFDTGAPGEDRRMYRLVNRLHRNTRDAVIRELLLFKPGDPYRQRQVAESERILRDTAYLYDARIRPGACADGRVDVVVDTRDVWSLEGGVGFGRSGGRNSAHFGLQDRNFFGLGKSFGVQRRSDVDRDSSVLQFRDRNLLGRHVTADLSYAANSDGRAQGAIVERPFYALDSRWAAGLRWSTDERVDARYLLGQVNDRFAHREDQVELYGGISRGLVGGRTLRWTFGATAERHRFGSTAGRPAPVDLPARRDVAYAWIGLESVHDGFFVTRDLERLQRSEDLNLSRQWSLRLGAALPALGSDRGGAVVRADIGSGLRPSPRQLLFCSGRLSGRSGPGWTPENVRFGGALRYYLREHDDNVFFVTAEAEWTDNLDPEEQVLIGGDSGLRGYPLRYQAGDRRALFTVEQRWYTDWQPWKLFHVGAAAFADVGRAWFAGASPLDRYSWLRDAGVGLRLAPSRTAHGAMIHVDLAWPLDGDASIARTQVLVTTKEKF